MAKIGNYTEEYLLGRAEELVISKTAGSVVFDKDAEDRVPRFGPEEIFFEKVLGKGGFCTVKSVHDIRLSGPESSSESFSNGALDHVIQDRGFISKQYIRNGESRYAIKALSKDIKDPERFVAGIIDLTIESRFLSVIRHPNIIKMRAICSINPYSRGFFIVLDRLFDTLGDRIKAWKGKQMKLTGFARVRDLKGDRKKELWIDRLLVAYDICTALKYLHDNSIMYRDLKPDNIGFDVRGDVKVFDFGLAKEMKDEDREGSLYNLSANTGSLRYMAPEVALGKPYNEKVDIFSFAVLLWQMLALETPFENYNVSKHSDLVVHGNKRPPIDEKWSQSLKKLFVESWSPNISDRPDCQSVMDVLRLEFNPYLGESEVSALDISNKTARSMENY